MKQGYSIVRWLVASFALAALSGCAGYNHVLFMTKSNAGLDIDAAPPTAEINIARKEVVVAPTFDGGQTPPVLASFGSDINAGVRAPGRFLFGVDQTFAGGDAAMTMATCYAKDEGQCQAQRSTIVLKEEPKPTNSNKVLLNYLFGLQGKGEVKPFVFGTDAQLGLKVAWNGAGGPYPDTLKIGYNRKEFALAPVSVAAKTSADGKATTHEVSIPAFLATVNANAGAESAAAASASGGTTTAKAPGGVTAKWMQYFATGEAATQLATHFEVRRTMLTRIAPDQEQAFSKERREAAEALNSSREKMADDIVGKVAKADGTIDTAKLGTIANEFFEGDGPWADRYAGKQKDELRADLVKDYAPIIKNIHGNLAKLP